MREAVGELVGIIRRLRPHVVVTYDPDGGYGHPDHIQAHRVTTEAVAASAGDDYPGDAVAGAQVLLDRHAPRARWAPASKTWTEFPTAGRA